MATVLLVLHLLIALGLVGTVLLQRSEGGGLGMGASAGSFMTGRGSANLLTRTTAILAAAFFTTSLLLTILATNAERPASISERLGQKKTQGAPSEPPSQSPPQAPAKPDGAAVTPNPAPSPSPSSSAAPAPPSPPAAPDAPAPPRSQ